MIVGRRFVAATSALVAVALLSGCAANEMGSGGDSTLSGTLVGGGASSQQAAQEAWVAGFQTMHGRATIEYDPAGSGAGRETFIAGGSSFAGSDRAFTAKEIADTTFAPCTPESGIVQLPSYISPIAIIFKLDGIESLRLNPGTIARIFSAQITQWDDPAIAALNPGLSLPSLNITAVHRADDSGVTENFTEYLAATAPDVWTFAPDGEWPIKGGEAAQGTSGVVDAVSRGVGTIGYADASRAGTLGTVAVKVGSEFVSYSPEAAAAIVDVSPLAEGRGPGDLSIDINRTSEEAGVYPIVLISYLIGCESYADATKGELTRAYFGYVISPEAQDLAASYAGSAPISESLFERASAAVALIR